MSDFNNEYNLSYISDFSESPSKKLIIKHYLCSIILYGIAICLFYFCNWFISNLQNTIFSIKLQSVFAIIYFLYVILAPIFLFIIKPKSIYNSFNILIFEYLQRVFTDSYNNIVTNRTIVLKELNKYKPTDKESQAISWYLLRLLFIPIMATFTLLYISVDYSIIQKIMTINTANLELSNILTIYRDNFFAIILTSFYAIDAIICLIAYFWNFGKDRIRTIDTSALGIISCLICYMPFKNILDSVLTPYPENNHTFVIATSESIMTWVLYILMFICAFIWITSTLSLFTKSSNLTNRGTVSKFPYNIIRHPAYTSKIILWFLCAVPLILGPLIDGTFLLDYQAITVMFGSLLYIFFYTIIYIIRALSEERNLLKDPEYNEYCKKVKFRFIPRVW